MSEPRDSPLRDMLDDQENETTTRRHEPLFDSDANSTGSIDDYIPAEDTRTDAERAELLAWVDCVVARNSHYGPKHPLYKPPPPGAADATEHDNGDTGDTPASHACECAVLREQLPQTQAQFTEPMMRVGSKNGVGVAQSTSMEGGPACPGSGVIDLIVEGATNDRPAP